MTLKHRYGPLQAISGVLCSRCKKDKGTFANDPQQDISALLRNLQERIIPHYG